MPNCIEIFRTYRFSSHTCLFIAIFLMLRQRLQLAAAVQQWTIWKYTERRCKWSHCYDNISAICHFTFAGPSIRRWCQRCCRIDGMATCHANIACLSASRREALLPQGKQLFLSLASLVDLRRAESDWTAGGDESRAPMCWGGRAFSCASPGASMSSEWVNYDVIHRNDSIDGRH